MFSVKSMKWSLSFLKYVSSPPRTSVSHPLKLKCGAINKLCILIYLLLVISLSNNNNSRAQALLLDTSASLASSAHPSAGGGFNGGLASSGSSASAGLDQKFSLDDIGKIFHRVAYATTTKRSIPDNVFVPSLTTVPTPSLTTFRYFDKESQINDQHQQQIKSHHNKYESDLERDHVLPTSAPNADILKSNNNPTYPNPNRHHNHNNHRHQNATPTPQGHNKKTPTHPGNNMPSYSPPTRSFFTPPLPREYSNPFADKPTLRGTNSEVGIMDTGTFMNRRPIPPPSLMPGHERVPIRPDLSADRPGVSISTSQTLNTDLQQPQQASQSSTKKVNLNTPSHKVNKLDLGHHSDSGNSNRLLLNSDNASDVSKIIPSISRILSGSNGRKEDIPDVLLRTVTVRPIPQIMQATNEPAPDKPPPQEESQKDDEPEDDDFSNGAVAKGNKAAVVDEEDEDDLSDDDEFDDFTSASQSNNMKNNEHKNKQDDGDKVEQIYSTENIQNLANVNHDRNLLTSTSTPQNLGTGSGSNLNNHLNGGNKLNGEQSEVATWTIAWDIHVYLSAILFTVLAVYSIFKMMFYDKLTHLFNQSYFICIHLFLIIICLARIFYLCYDAYNIHLSFDPFISELLLNLPATLLTVAFATLILFLLIRSLNHKNNRYSPLMRPLTVLVACSVHVGLCITLHYVESYESKNYNFNLQQQQQQNAGGSTYNTNNFKYYNNIIRGHSGPPRLLSLICQIIYIFVCLSLGIFYLYIYRILKRVLRNKSQNYIHGYQNLSYAIHITIAIALLFVSMATLQIYGAISVSSTKSLSAYAIDINWPQWGYQFSLRLIEVTIIALLSWVTGLKTGASDMQLNALNIDNGHIPPHGARTGLDFQLVNPNGFARSYETNSFRSIGGVGIHANPSDTIKHHPHPPQLHHHHPQQHHISHQPQINNDSDRDYFSNDNNSTVIPDHYENPNFELRHDNPGSSSDSNNQHNMDDYYSEPLNAQGIPVGHPSIHQHPHQSHLHLHQKQPATPHDAYESRSLNQPQMPQAVVPPQSGYDFQNFERPTFDRSSSRNEFRVSKNLKAMKSNTNTLNYNYDNSSNHSSSYGFTSSAAAAGNNNGNFNNNSFERRSGVRKSGTLNNIGAIHHARGGGGGGSGSTTNGLNGGCNSSSSSSSGIVVGRNSGIQTLNSRSTQHLQQQQQQQQQQHQQYERDFQRNTSGRLSSNKNKHYNQAPSQMGPVPIAQRGANGVNGVLDQYQSSSGDSATSGSMLVAEHGFVRFRELSDIGINEC